MRLNGHYLQGAASLKMRSVMVLQGYVRERQYDVEFVVIYSLLRSPFIFALVIHRLVPINPMEILDKWLKVSDV